MKAFFFNILHEHIFFKYFISNRSQRRINIAAHIPALFHLLRMYTVGCYCALVILYFIPFLSVFYFYILSILAPPASAYCFLFLSVNQAARGARDDTLFLYSRSAPFRGTERPADSRTKNHNRRSRGEIHGGLLTSREGDLRVSMQIPVVAPWRGGRRWRRREEGRSG